MCQQVYSATKTGTHDASRRYLKGFITPNVNAVYPPCPDAQAFRRFVRGTGAWRIHCR
jgi:hypothetical protein